MCDPVTAVVVGVAALTSVGNSLSQRASVKAQAKNLSNQAQAASDEATREASAEMFDNMRAARREAGKTRAAAGEAGLSLESGSVEDLLMDSAMQSELKNDRTLANLESRNKQINNELQAKASQLSMPTTLGMLWNANMAAGQAFLGSPAGVKIGSQTGAGG